MRDESDAIDSLERTDDEVELVLQTDETYPTLWERLDPGERGPWLVANGFSVRITKKLVVVTQGDRSVETDL